MEKRFLWLLWGRVIVITAILVSALLVFSIEGGSLMVPLLLVAVGVYLLSVVYYLLLHFLGRLWRVWIFIQLVVDVLVVSLLVHFTGGFASSLSVLYFLVIMTASLYLYAYGGLMMAGLSTLAYAVLFWGELAGWIPVFSLVGGEELPLAHAILKLYVYALLFFFVAAVSGYLSENVRFWGEKFSEIKITTEDILENLGSGVLTVDRDGRVVYFNCAGRKMLGVRQEDIQGYLLKAILPRRWMRVGRMLERTIEKEERSEGELKVGKRWYLLKTGLVHNAQGVVIGGILIVEDRTERREMEEKIRVMDRMAAIGEMSAGIAHEIRNPLATIQGAVEVLAKGRALKAKKKKLLDLIVRETEHLNRIIGDFLEFTKYGKLSPEPVELSNLFEEVIGLFGDDERVSWVRVIPPKRKVKFLADRLKLLRALYNVLDNALKAVAGQESPEIVLRGRLDDEWVRIEVFDNGCGFPEEDACKIFQPFYSLRPGGTGLGLAIVHRIVTLHRGEISARSIQGKGTSVVIKLPVGG
mgnify:CR=1 FL=1